MGPGPSNVAQRVLDAGARPTIGHLDPAFMEFMDDLKGLLRWVFRTSNTLTMPVSGPGTAGMEACFANLLEPGDTAVICRNGVFGQRMVEMVERLGARAVVVDDEWGRAVDPRKVEDTLKQTPEASLLAFVQAETSTGAQSDGQALAELARRYDCLSLMDCVTSLGGTPVEIDAWGVDAAYSGTQKCLSAPPGLSPVTMSDAAAERIRQRRTPVQSWFMDFRLVMNYWGSEGRRSYHHTAPVNALYGLHEALLAMREEGLESVWDRHARLSADLRGRLESLGLEYLVPKEESLPQLNTVRIPAAVDDAAARLALLQNDGIEIGAGLGPLAGSVWRIGLMGESCRAQYVERCADALARVLELRVEATA
ncbi:pyridoxal-phosphate-dependent aminotransferase family protein [Methylonatrum kenyense]|uniref:pyridoxal-phosphate-dependent aminotransferase family protein n=1 Tax=Methylonatrum kenyense TaxID=455253 RepID=UPI003D107FDF